MALPDLESMTVSELDTLTVSLKRQIESIRAERLAIKQVRDRKVWMDHLAKKLGIDVSGLTEEQVKSLLEIAKQTPPKPGDVILAPDPAVLKATTNPTELDLRGNV